MAQISTKEYANELREVLNYNRYANLAFSIGVQLNDHKNRFDKSDLLELSLELYSNERLKYVNLIGRDHRDTKYNFDIEMKYVYGCLITPKGRYRKFVNIKIKNSHGARKSIKIVNPAHYYLICQHDAMAIISYDDLVPCLEAVDDGIVAKIPSSKLDFIFRPSDIRLKRPPVNIRYQEEKKKMQRKIIESILTVDNPLG